MRVPVSEKWRRALRGQRSPARGRRAGVGKRRISEKGLKETTRRRWEEEGGKASRRVR